MDTDETTPLWEDLIMRHTKDDNFKSSTCAIYNRKAFTLSNANTFCRCGRLVRCHSFDGERLPSLPVYVIDHIPDPQSEFNPNSCSTDVPVTIFGKLKSNGCKFIRIGDQSDMSTIYKLLVDDCGGDKPPLILSIYGGAKYFTMVERLEKEIIRGIIDIATKADAWILTTGVNTGVAKLVGEGVAHFRLLKEDSTKMKCIGLTMWGTVNESTRLELKHATNGYPEGLLHRQISDNIQEDEETIEKNHTHCILFDNGRLIDYLGDLQRSALVTQACEDKHEKHLCYGVTIIIEGGIGTLTVLENDIAAKRPIVLIQGSGRLADTLASLIEMISISKENQQFVPTAKDIKEALYQFFPNRGEFDPDSVTRKIQHILNPTNRYLLNIFSLDRGNNIAETIFKAIYTMENMQNETDQSQHLEEEEVEEKLIKLALKWNYIDGVMPILKSRQTDMKKDRDVRKKHMQKNKELFKISLINNHPAFVEYFLAAGFDPRTLIEIQDISQRSKKLLQLYKDRHDHMNKSHAECIKTVLGTPYNRTIDKIDKKLNKLIGSYIGAIYSTTNNDYSKRFSIDMENHICICFKYKKERSDELKNKDKSSHNQNDSNNDKSPYTKEELLRDLFLWSVLMDMPEMAKILLVHLQPRICAALIASTIFKAYTKASTAVDHKEKFKSQSLEFETYAAMFTDKCYEYNGNLACELLLRQIPLFGNVTCMQVAISSGSRKLVGTSCFNQILRQVWYNRLSVRNHQTDTKPLKFLSIVSGGLLAPWILPYRDEENKSKDELLSSEGINYFISEEQSQRPAYKKYWPRFLDFHESPMTRMFYHFITYIGFLLVFSYMMLYRLDSPGTSRPHWTEIYVIFTVSTMLCEEIRKLCHDYKTRMIEQWTATESALLKTFSIIFYVTPYILFYLGLGLRYGGHTDDILTAAKIIWAFDLEMWYLGSLKFMIAFKSVGPKLFMLKNMFRDLAGFLYMIFIAIVAYGVVSRALIFYQQVPFTGRGILGDIIYEPYWFIFGGVSDKDILDENIKNDTGSIVAEATATHFLLAFHMLFINILILNLLIAVFTFTIDKVQENTRFYWRYQRYSLIREYFERPPFAYPPLIIVSHILLACSFIRDNCCPKLFRNRMGDGNHPPGKKSLTPIFKMIPVDGSKKNDRWNDFEHAATHSYARSIIEQEKKKGILTADDIYPKTTMNTTESDGIKVNSSQEQMIKKLKELDSDQQPMISSLKEEISTIKSVVAELNKQMKQHVQQMNESLQWTMKTMERVKMNNPNERPPSLSQ